MKIMTKLVSAACLLLGTVSIAATAPLVSTQADREEISLTVYNAGLGLVRDRRSVQIGGGVSELRFMNVAAQVIPASVQISTSGAMVHVLEQNYEYDLLNPQKLLDKYVGKEVLLFQKNPYSEREEEVKALLLANNGAPIFKIGNAITFNHPGRVIFPEVPADLIATPTLLWLLEAEESGKRQVEASYLTAGISWKADYILTLSKESGVGDIAGWVTIDNRSGATYRDARLKLVAGDVNRVREEQPRGRIHKTALAEMAAAPQFKEEGLFEYHLYTLQRPSTIKDSQTKQIRLLSAEKVPVHRELLVKSDQTWYGAPQGNEGLKQKVGVFVEFDNRKSAGIGMPLPKGTIRVYQPDSDGGAQFIGEDAIDHTPENDKVRVKIGDAFDLAVTRKQTDWKKLANDTYEAGWEIVVRNHKKEDVTVKVQEPMTGEWQVIQSSHAAIRRDVQTAEFSLPVKQGSETTLTYRVKVRY